MAMTNTDRLIAEFNACQAHGVVCRFATGRYTGNGTSVVGALRRRGYTVNKLKSSYYEIAAAPEQAAPITATQAMEAHEAGRVAAIMGNADIKVCYSTAALADCYSRGVAEGLQQLADQAAQDKLTRRVLRERR